MVVVLIRRDFLEGLQTGSEDTHRMLSYFILLYSVFLVAALTVIIPIMYYVITNLSLIKNLLYLVFLWLGLMTSHETRLQLLRQHKDRRSEKKKTTKRKNTKRKRLPGLKSNSCSPSSAAEKKTGSDEDRQTLI